ncbi:MAG: GNAT family N-acetyltransferase [Syntrophaceae bacterium]|nr:GNAT family N-acetyltransferase [Syntrophaceae bacterium]
MAYRIRTCTQNDTAVLAETIRAAFRDVAVRFGLTEQNCPRHPSNCRADWVEKDMERGVTYYALESGGSVAGSVALERVRPGLCNLERLAVLPGSRGRGFGRALVNHVLTEARQRGCDTVRIGIIEDQAELKEWYRRLGFLETETRDFARLPFRVSFMARPPA